MLASQNEVVTLRAKGDGHTTTEKDEREYIAILREICQLIVYEVWDHTETPLRMVR